MNHLVTPEELLVLYLPEGTDLSRYKVVDTVYTPDDTISPFIGRVEVMLEEQNIIPPDIQDTLNESFDHARIVSKGFYDPVQLYDFPIRNKLAKLVVRRRRWINLTT